VGSVGSLLAPSGILLAPFVASRAKQNPNLKDILKSKCKGQLKKLISNEINKSQFDGN
jgi:hypothetical protein